MKKFKFDYKRVLPHVIAIAIFYIVTVVYFAPIFFEGKDLMQGDVTSYLGWGEDTRSYYQQTGEMTFWSNAMFSGMPSNYAFPPKTNSIFAKFSHLFTGFLPGNTAGPFFAYMLGFYILLLVLGCSSWLSVLGAIAYALCSYNLIIIDAGHVSKALVMSTMAPVIAGVMLCYKGKYLPGALIALLATGMNVYWNHQQISYYLIIVLACLAIAYFINAIVQRTMKRFFIASSILVAAALLAAAPAVDKLVPTMDFSKETMRGGAVLKTDAQGNTENSGLNIDYAYQWSYGIDETFTLLVPNCYGASSHYNLGDQSETYRALRGNPQARQFCTYAPTYWGNQPFTAGPVYGGAILCFLFLLGMIIVKGHDRWWMLAAIIICILMAWGKNFLALNQWLFEHLPLYNKFRTPSMSLVIANVLMTALGIQALSTIARAEKPKQYLPQIIIAASATAALTIIYMIYTFATGSFAAATDAQLPEFIRPALEADRRSMLSGDAWRSVLFIALAFVPMLVYQFKKFDAKYLYIIVGLLIIVDLWSVDRRFVGKQSFVPKHQARNITPTPIDRQILTDTDPNYRVLNLTTSTFNESRTSYFHKSVGGYSPVKLRRYQDIIDYYISGQINPNVLNMLNTRYIIFSTQEGPQYQFNPAAMGNAWFVDNIEWMPSPDDEIQALGDANLHTTALIDEHWRESLPAADALLGSDSTATIEMTALANPGKIAYHTSASKPRLAVFSEVYYKTWHAYIDGEETPIVRANYILRAIAVPEGEHDIEFRCVDQLYLTTHRISLILSIITGVVILLLLGGICYQEFKPQLNPTSL